MELEADTIEFENVDVADVKHVLGPSFRNRRTTVMVTIADAQMGMVDMQQMMEMGMNVARFKTSHSTKSDKVKLINNFDKAATFLAQKYGLLEWPCATAIDLKTSIVQTGLLKEDVPKLMIRVNTEVVLTADIAEFDKCNAERIFVDNPYLLSDVREGMEINIAQAEIILRCISKSKETNSVKCFVEKGGYLTSMAYVCMRGAIRTRPYISKKDYHLIKFALEYQIDMIIINYPRHIDTLTKIKRYLGSKARRPIIITGISSQEGLLSIDDFVREADGILLSREFLPYEVEPALFNRMGHVQSFIAGKCRQAGKPFFISGGVYNEAVMYGTIISRELSDVTNAILEGVSGFALRDTPNIEYLMEAMRSLNELCASVEPMCMGRVEFWQLLSQIKMPVNAAEAAAMSCAAVANQTNARIIVVPTVTGRTANLLNWLRPNSIVIGVSTKIRTIRRLKTFRSIIALLYKGVPRRTWFNTVQARINFAIQYAVEKHWINYGDYYVALEKGTEASSFCDAVRVWTVTTTKKNVIECPESYHDFNIHSYPPTSNVTSNISMKKDKLVPNFKTKTRVSEEFKKIYKNKQREIKKSKENMKFKAEERKNAIMEVEEEETEKEREKSREKDDKDNEHADDDVDHPK